MGRNIHVCLKLLITSILLVISCSAQQEGDATGSPGELNQKWNDFKVEYGIKSITQGPSNAVAEIGKQVKLTCTAETPIAYWAFSKDGSDTDMQIIVGPGCYSVNSPFGDHYALETLGGGTTCNLIVFEITMEQAGVYSCTEAQNNLFSILTVIDSPPAVTVNTTEPVLEDDKVVITCSLSYEGSVAPAPTLRPHFYWKHINDYNVSSSYDSTTETTSVSQYIVTAEAFYNITPYTCHVYFQLMPPATAFYANNIPSVNISVASPTIEVLYGAQVTSISRYYKHLTIGGITCEINVMWCYAHGNPPPSYEWFDTVENVSITKEYTFDLAEIDRKYTCVVNNTVRNVEYYDSQVVPGENYTIIQDCRFPHSESTWIAAVPVQGCGNGTCACSSDNDGFHLLCNANSFPSALYQWTGADNDASCPRVYDNVKTNGIYRCTAYFDQPSSNYTGNYIFPNGTSEKNVTECYDPCITAPCLNGGTCSSAPNGGYTCSCDPQVTGINCETVLTLTLVVTADRAVVSLFVDNVSYELSSYFNWSIPDHIAIPAAFSLIALRASNSFEADCSGILGSIGADFVTDASWKCSTDNTAGWYRTDYNDSHWPQAITYDLNTPPFVCDYRHQIPEISAWANWIWTSNMGVSINCRVRLDQFKGAEHPTA